MRELNRESIVQWSKSPVAAEVGDEVVLMNLPRGRCYGLGSVGTDLWRKMGQPIRVADLIHSLSEDYLADPAVLASDVIETLEQYAAEGLIQVSNKS